MSDGLELADYIRAGVIFASSVVLAYALQVILQRSLEREGSERLRARVAGRFVSYLIVSVGLVYALHTLEVAIGPVLGALGIGGIALALASQDILANAVDGLLLEVRRPLRRGEQVKTLEFEGTVIDVNLRAVVLHSFDGHRVYVPNTTVYRNTLVNYTRNGRRRTTLTIGLDYDTDLPQAKEIALRVCAGVDGVLERPEPEAWIEEFADSTITLAVRFWHAPDIATLWRVRDAVAVALKQAYDDAGVTIAFPQVVMSRREQAPARKRAPSRRASSRRSG